MKILYKITQLIIALFIGAIIFIGLMAYQKYNSTPLKERPYPFSLDKSVIPEASLDFAQNSDILIIGDSFALKNDKLVEILTDNLSRGLKKPLTIQSIATENENIFRTKYRLYRLQKLPPIIIYLGGTSEFAEALYPENLNIFQTNFNRYRNEYISTLIMLFPRLSKLLYEKDKDIVIGKEAMAPFKSYSDQWFQKVSEAIYHFYQEELLDLADYVGEKNSTLILATAPVNLELEPKKVCENSILDEITIKQAEISKLLKEQKYKQAQTLALSLDEHSTGNSMTKYLLGMTLLKQGKNALAIDLLKEAKALECTDLGANVIINEIIKSVSTEKGLSIVKFDELLYDKIGNEELFLFDNTIQFIHWDLFIKGLTKNILEALQL